ncbi:polysaccharide pyruvyl transferase family protein [Qaidamihabitans albus]|uniref:polysaccharide pyruvyl transferase family protein n=1 Tax=Qaidamihabitans albus TaxID=2795733 RepID=UPI0018F1FB22|nr:polysaccharide pyruvyl transferase family protein [Qaidamihabitans albus]
MRVLVTGWPTFLHGEATAGDVLSMRGVASALAEEGIAADTAWSPGFRPGALHLDDADPARYTHVVFTCGPAHGEQVSGLHERYAGCRRIAVGVSVLDPADPAAAGFHRVLARDGGSRPYPDLSLSGGGTSVPVAGVVLAPGQREYGARRRHEQVHEALLDWASRLDCARVPLDTRLDGADWRHCATADQFLSLIRRFDVIITTRLHGLVLALRAGVPALAVDPVAGGGKVAAQAEALDWPAVVPAETVTGSGGDAALGRWWEWCLSAGGRERARHPAPLDGAHPLLTELLAEVRR